MTPVPKSVSCLGVIFCVKGSSPLFSRPLEVTKREVRPAENGHLVNKFYSKRKQEGNDNKEHEQHKKTKRSSFAVSFSREMTKKKHLKAQTSSRHHFSFLYPIFFTLPPTLIFPQIISFLLFFL